ncbi:MAG: hypothetical protein IKS07_05235, partial [Lachnospiraceae bacterium]|nr:hypothetical protein [Lachnospiraceae bacterium]
MGNRFAETEKTLRAGLLQKAPELLDSAALILLALYPLRNIHIGGDLMDTGYNYANFRYMGTEHMDPMWLFSTYLGNSLGHLFSMLPFGHSILGLNFYTGLVLSLIAVISYLFCTRKLRTGTAPAMIGIFLALNLCWCPTALLYNYLTYLFLLAALICLYRGLTADRFGPLLVAGFLLGLNVFVRFPNVAQISLVAILWIYGFFEHPVNLKAESKKVRGREIRENLRNAALRTLHVLGGYLSALFIMLLYLGIRYGFSSYFEGIARLFQMTDTASDYQASSMLRGILLGFWKQSYWMVRILFFAFAGCVLCSGAKYLERRFGALFREDRQVRDYRHGFSFLKTAYALSGVAAAGMVVWLVTRRNANGDPAFTSNVYYSYDPIVAPATVFLACVIAVAAIRTFSRKAELSERLISMLIAGQILISCIGSNNGLFPGFNN